MRRTARGPWTYPGTDTYRNTWVTGTSPSHRYTHRTQAYPHHTSPCIDYIGIHTMHRCTHSTETHSHKGHPFDTCILSSLWTHLDLGIDLNSQSPSQTPRSLLCPSTYHFTLYPFQQSPRNQYAEERSGAVQQAMEDGQRWTNVLNLWKQLVYGLQESFCLCGGCVRL